MEVSMEYLIITEAQNKKRIIKKICDANRLEKIKVISYQEFIKKFYFDYTKETIYYICNTYKVSKEIAEIYLINLYNIKETKEKIEKVEFLKQLKQDLIKHNLLEFNLLWKEKLKTKKLVFYHITKKDKFYKELIKECEKITTVQNIDYESSPKSYEIKEYVTIEEEVIGIINEICELLKKEEEPSKIYLTNLTSDYRKYLSLYAPMFHLPLSLKNEESYISNHIVTNFLQQYDQGIKNVIESLKEKYQKAEEQEIIHQIINICNEYAFIKDEEKKKNFIVTELKNTKKKNQVNSNSIHEIDFQTEDIDIDSHIFVLGAYESAFPLLQKDEQYLSDQELIKLNLSTSEEQNKIKKELFLTKLDWYQNIHMSYPRKDGKLELYLSSILEERKCTIQKMQKESFLHSDRFNQLMLAKKLDTLKKYGTEEENLKELLSTYESIPYNKYENTFTGVKIPTLPIKLSYTSLDVFFHCAFHYYLEYILKINNFEESLSIKIGRLFHQVLMEYYEDNFDFESSWQKNIQGFEFPTKKELFFITNLKNDLKRVVDTLKKQEEGKPFKIITEEKINYDLDTDTQLTGIIDKIFYKEEKERTLVSIVDYKTGTPSLNLDNLIYGLNMQLPIYQLLLKKFPLKNIEIIGFYLQKILPSIPERDGIHTEEELKIQNLKLQGYSTDKESVLSVFDPTYENSKLIKSMRMSSKGFYSYAKVLSEENLKKIEEITLKNIKFAANEIKSGHFKINPKRIGGKLIGCDYCPYQSICYRKEKDIQNEREQKLVELLGGEKNAIMDERTE